MYELKHYQKDKEYIDPLLWIGPESRTVLNLSSALLSFFPKGQLFRKQ
jgi:hypothetical protein